MFPQGPLLHRVKAGMSVQISKGAAGCAGARKRKAIDITVLDRTIMAIVINALETILQ